MVLAPPYRWRFTQPLAFWLRRCGPGSCSMDRMTLRASSSFAIMVRVRAGGQQQAVALGWSSRSVVSPQQPAWPVSVPLPLPAKVSLSSRTV
jgi:hypothetical protein